MHDDVVDRDIAIAAELEVVGDVAEPGVHFARREIDQTLQPALERPPQVVGVLHHAAPVHRGRAHRGIVFASGGQNRRLLAGLLHM